MAPSKAIVSFLVFRVLTITDAGNQTSAVEHVTEADMDTLSFLSLVKVYGQAINTIMPCVNIDIDELIGMNIDDDLVEIDEPNRIRLGSSANQSGSGVSTQESTIIHAHSAGRQQVPIIHGVGVGGQEDTIIHQEDYPDAGIASVRGARVTI